MSYTVHSINENYFFIFFFIWILIRFSFPRNKAEVFSLIPAGKYYAILFTQRKKMNENNFVHTFFVFLSSGLWIIRFQEIRLRCFH